MKLANVDLKVISANISWNSDRPELKHYILSGGVEAERVISWVYNTSCSNPEIIIGDCESILTRQLSHKKTGLNSSLGVLYSVHEQTGIENLAEIKDEWDFNNCTFLPIEDLIKVINKFVSLYQGQKEGNITFSAYSIGPELRADLDSFNENKEPLI